MEYKVFLANKTAMGDIFTGLILPTIVRRLESPTVFLAGALDGRQAVGAAVLELTHDGGRLLSIAVREDYRRQGIGTALLRQCVQLLRRTELPLQLSAALLPEETEAAALLAFFGMAREDSEMNYYRFPLSAAAQILPLLGNGAETLPLKDVPYSLLREYLLKISYGNISQYKRKQMDMELSRVLIEKGQVTACLLVERMDGDISIGRISTGSSNKMAVRHLLGGTLTAAVKAELPETSMDIVAYGEAAIRLVEGLLRDAVQKQCVHYWQIGGIRLRRMNFD